MAIRALSKRMQYARIALALAGLAFSVYLALSAVLNIPVACPATGVINCDKLLNSLYAKTFGIPNTDYGILFFLMVLALIFLKQHEPLLLLNAVGIGFVAYFIQIEYVAGSICVYCTGVHISTIALFLISLYEISGGPKGT